MNSRELVIKTISFQNSDRIPCDFLSSSDANDFVHVDMQPSPNASLSVGIDEWGCVWENIGKSCIGQVIGHPIRQWSDLDSLQIPDITESHRWKLVEKARSLTRDKFLLGHAVSLYHRACYLRGEENFWIDLYEDPEQACRLLDILVDMNLKAIDLYAKNDIDGIFFADDWGLQDRLLLNPAIWREIWKPRYEATFSAVHQRGMSTFLHSCGYILDILDDLIEVGLDVVNLDQQENMGLEELGKRYRGRITFFCPADVQTVLTKNDSNEVREYCRRMEKTLGTSNGGFIPKSYPDHVGIGHAACVVGAMYDEFINISRRKQGVVA